MVLFVISSVTCFLLAGLLKKVLAQSKLSTVKERPMLLGIAIYGAILITTIFAFSYYGFYDLFVGKLMIGSFLILLLGIIDDVRKLSVRAKFSGQVAVAIIAVILGIKTTIAYFPLWVNILITILWVTALVNAFNLLDIMDGLCIGISLIVSAFFLLASLLTGTSSMVIFFVLLTGAILASLIYNFPPAKLYLGDAGSMLLGFIFACSTLQISYAPDFSERLSLFVPVLILAVPLYDLAFTMLTRRRKGISVVQKSKDHLVFVMKNAGFSTKKILMIIYGLCVAFGCSALLLKALDPFFKMWLLFIIASASVILMIKISRIKELKN